MRVLVTGSGGFIGRRIVDLISASGDVEVLAGRRSAAPDPRLPASATTVRADVTEPGSLHRALEGVDAVVHAAVGDRAVTVEGTEAVLTAAAEHGVARVVHLSSIAVYGSATGTVTEATRFPSKASGYAAWKIAAERAALASAVPVVRLRPTIVYGAGGEQWIGSAVRRLRSGHWGTLGSLGEGTCNPVHVDDVARAVLAALTSAATGAFNVNGPETLSWNDWFLRLAAGVGIAAPPVVSPAAARFRVVAAQPAKVVGRVRPDLVPPALRDAPGLGELRAYSRTATYPVDTARQALGWSPRIGLDQGIAESLAGRAR